MSNWPRKANRSPSFRPEYDEADLDEYQKQLFAYALASARSAFAVDDTDLGCTEIFKHKIDTGNAIPMNQSASRTPFSFREELENLLHEMLEQGVIEASNSPCASPIVFVKNKDGSLRFCIDFRKVNAFPRKDNYPLPRIDELLDSLNKSKYFWMLDLQSGFWQIAMDDEAKPKTAFASHLDLYQFTKMPFGLAAAPATFQKLMDCFLTGLNGLIRLFSSMT